MTAILRFSWGRTGFDGGVEAEIAGGGVTLLKMAKFIN